MMGTSRLSRRRWLRAAGVSVALPLLDFPRRVAADPPSDPPQRMLLISNNLSVLPKLFFPEESGRDYRLSPYLEELAEFRGDFTVCSGLSHPDVTGGHSTENCFLTAAPGPTKSGFRNTISLDQFAAERLGPVTRYATLNLGVNIDKAHRSLAWTRDGALLPAEDSPSAVFRQLFLQGDPEEVRRQLQRLDERGSILDALLDDARSLRRELGRDSRLRLEQYMASIRDVEGRLQAARQWSQRPKPTIDQEPPTDIQDSKLFFEKFDLMLSMARLGLESDSTRIVTLMADAFATPMFQLQAEQVSSEGYHGLSHHGQVPDKLRQLEDADRRQMRLLRRLLEALSERREGDARMLDRTMVLFGSNLGDANTHDNTNLPILLAGGGFRHGSHLAFRRDHNTPLCNLFLSMLRRLGIETDEFGSSQGALSGLEA